MVRLEVWKEVFLPSAGISEALLDSNNIFSILNNMFCAAHPNQI